MLNYNYLQGILKPVAPPSQIIPEGQDPRVSY
jgi:hypothetical protein